MMRVDDMMRIEVARLSGRFRCAEHARIAAKLRAVAIERLVEAEAAIAAASRVTATQNNALGRGGMKRSGRPTDAAPLSATSMACLG